MHDASPERTSSWRELLRIAVVVLVLGGAYVGLNVVARHPSRVLTGVELTRPAPDFRLRDIDGNWTTLEALKGKVVLMVFWATWCRPCIAEIPVLVRLQRELGGKDVVVLGVNNETGQGEMVADFARKRGINYPVVVDDGQLTRAWKVTTLPSVALIDRAGRVAWKHTGLVGRSELLRQISEVL